MRASCVRAGLLPAGLELMAATGAAWAAGAVYAPTRGVLSDKPAGFCADVTGVSATWTEQYLGAAAAHKLAVMMTDPAGFDGSAFGFSNRVYCDTKTRVCTKSKISTQVDQAATKVLFGRLPPAAGSNH